MNKREVLEQLDSLIDNEVWIKDVRALKIAKKIIKEEYKFKSLCMAITLFITMIIFGSFVAMTYFMYYR
ncbi:hypothetical protein DP144_02015 [Clostridium tetani]|uniref:hypothetical protein n=1 Tax=Clostridium tetani TaxID=1513 RepID=UPI00100C1B2A|nr:hypothetical protein [Clostridium tetani]RXM79606.1 hypothetical protein DP154_02010 [Clostridium tetani]RYV00420.1 hypothetical protein DP144_02015 [Clostridium tetani]